MNYYKLCIYNNTQIQSNSLYPQRAWLFPSLNMKNAGALFWQATFLLNLTRRTYTKKLGIARKRLFRQFYFAECVIGVILFFFHTSTRFGIASFNRISHH